MRLFALEALDARSGDSLIVHCGTTRNPRFLLVDGGFAATYSDVLQPRLNEIHVALDPARNRALPIDLVLVSHIDNDHITGVVRLCRELRDVDQRGEARPYQILRMWHNAFLDSLEQLAHEIPAPDTVVEAAEARASGVHEGRELRDLARFLHCEGNPPFGGFVVGPREVDLGNALVVTVVGPSTNQLDALRREWLRDVKPRMDRGEIAAAAAYLDDAAANLSSIVIHLRQGSQTMLLTGDARGDQTLAQLQAAGLLRSGERLHVDVLKLPHHGSDRTIDRDYFETIVADHYVISANGRHGNPSQATLRWLVESQGSRRYSVHLTNNVPHAIDLLNADRAQANRNYDVRVRRPDDPSVIIQLEGSAL